MITPNDLQRSLHDLARTIPLSGVNEDWQIYAYDYNGTARVIVLAVTALAKSREAENPTQTNAHPMCFQRISNADRIRAMTDEELLNLLCLKHCPTSIDPAFKCKDIGNCKPCWEEWLKQEVGR